MFRWYQLYVLMGHLVFRWYQLGTTAVFVYLFRKVKEVTDMKEDSTAVLINEILNVFVPVFVDKEVDASSTERYNPSTSTGKEKENEG